MNAPSICAVYLTRRKVWEERKQWSTSGSVMCAGWGNAAMARPRVWKVDGESMICCKLRSSRLSDVDRYEWYDITDSCEKVIKPSGFDRSFGMRRTAPSVNSSFEETAPLLRRLLSFVLPIYLSYDAECLYTKKKGRTRAQRSRDSRTSLLKLYFVIFILTPKDRIPLGPWKPTDPRVAVFNALIFLTVLYFVFMVPFRCVVIFLCFIWLQTLDIESPSIRLEYLQFLKSLGKL